VAAGREDFEAFVAARYDALLRTAYLLTGDHHDAEDLLQQALVKAAGAWGRINEPDAYVRTVLVRTNVSRWRRRRWREVSTDSPRDVPVTDDGAEDRLVLQRALACWRPGSERWWCCGTTRTSPRSRPRPPSGSRSAR
jgi:DNA-directed RNA polymerase specialized sigma24 family protein